MRDEATQAASRADAVTTPADSATKPAQAVSGSGNTAHTESRSARLASYAPLALALGVYIALRAWILRNAFDEVALPMFELYPMGTIAELFLRGVDFPLQYFYDNAAGQVLMGLATVPYFATFGATYQTLKLVPATLGAATLVLLYVFLRTHFSRTAAAIGALCFALGPTTLVKYSLINSGNHFENLFFTMLVACAFYGAHKARDDRGWLFAAGFAGGFAVFVFLGALVTLALFAFTHVLARGARRSARDLAWTLPGFVLGSLPLFLLNLDSQKGVGFLRAKFGAGGGASGPPAIERARLFVSEHLPRASCYSDLAGHSGRAADALFFAAFLVAFVAAVAILFVPVGRALLAWIPRSEVAASRSRFDELKLLPFALCLPVTALAYGFSNLKIGGYAPPIEMGGYRYFLPLFLFAIVIVAVVGARYWEDGGSRRFAGAALAGAALVAGIFNVGLVSAGTRDPWVGRSYPGYNLAQLARALLATRNDLAPEEVVERVGSLPVAWRHHVVTAIGFNAAVHEIEDLNAARRDVGAATDAGWTLALEPLFEARPAAWRADLARGAGIALRWMLHLGGGESGALDAHLSRIVAAGSPHAPRVVEGACLLGVAVPQAERAVENVAANRGLLEECSRSTRAEFARGSGFLCGRLLSRDIRSEREAVEESIGHARAWLSESERAAWWEGVGAGCAEAEDVVRPPRDFSVALDARERESLWFGFGARLVHNLGRALADEAIRASSVPIDDSDRRAMERGLARTDDESL